MRARFIRRTNVFPQRFRVLKRLRAREMTSPHPRFLRNIYIMLLRHPLIPSLLTSFFPLIPSFRKAPPHSATMSQKAYNTKATGPALATVEAHSTPQPLTLYGSCFCPFVQRILEIFQYDRGFIKCEVVVFQGGDKTARVEGKEPGLFVVGVDFDVLVGEGFVDECDDAAGD